MSELKVIIGSDHGGHALRDHLVKSPLLKYYNVTDGNLLLQSRNDQSALGSSLDYPLIAYAICCEIKSGDYDKAILICGSGVGMCIAANKVPGIKAAVGHDVYSCRQMVQHNKVNVLCLGGRVIGPDLATQLAVEFLKAFPFEEERYTRRLSQIDTQEKNPTWYTYRSS